MEHNILFYQLKVDIVIVHLTNINGMNGECLQSFFKMDVCNTVDIVPVMPLSPGDSIGRYKS